MKQQRAAIAAFFVFVLAGCSSSSGNGASGAPDGSSGASGAAGSSAQDAASGQADAGEAQGSSGDSFGDAGGFGSGTSNTSGTSSSDAASLSSIPTSIAAVIRDFRFYDAGDPTTDPDFENPPAQAMSTANGWDDPNIVADTLGADEKPVYKNPGSTTLTTHGQAQFDKWYRDTAGTNIHVDFPLPLTANADGSFGYDSETAGVPYGIQGLTGDGFFPIDDGSPYQTVFGNQGEPHNYSFTVEIHTIFTYGGGEYFNFRGDDDVFVFIAGKLVINLGGIHNPEPESVSVDTLGLTLGQSYPLDFFSAERHVVGSNIEFETTLKLQAPPE